MHRTIPLLAVLALLFAGACHRASDDRPIEVSLIGGTLRIVDPNQEPLNPASAALMQSTAQGLVRFDAAGQIEPALAERWIVSDHGRSIIFRLRPLRWADGRRLDAYDVARRLRAMIAARSRNPLKPLLGAVDEIVAMTPQVIDIRLTAPRPNLIQLFAQPEMAVLSGLGGSGPFEIASREPGALLLRPLPDPDADPSAPRTPAGREIRLRAERAGVAVARFASGRAALVTGGTFADLAVANAAHLRRSALRFDPVPGLFGLAVEGDSRFLADPPNRRALAMAVDRDRIVAAFDVPDWTPAAGLVPSGIGDLPQPALPDWSAKPLADRRAEATAQIRRWTVAQGQPPALRIALPEGSGARLLFTLVALDLRAIGVDAVRVPPDQRADLRLVDDVAPGDSASWYLRRFACAEGHPCTPESEAALDAARSAPDLAARSAQLAEADRQLAAIVPFIPIAAPVRWSLVAPMLDAWHESPRGRHPLDELRSPAR